MQPQAPPGRLLVPALRAQPDRRLVALAREDCEAASEEIVRRYRPALVRYAATIVPHDRADDVVQDSLAKALPRIAAGQAELHLRPWLYTIVRNTALNDLRDAPPPHQQIDESYDGVEQPPQALERQQSVRSLVTEMRALPAAQREALVKRELEGRGHDEIGTELGISAGAARQLIFRARESLRHALGSLLPMPLLRYLAEGGGGGGDGTVVAAAAGGGGGAIAIKAAVAIVATGAVVAGGVAVKQAERRERPAPAVAKQTRIAPPAANSNLGVAREAAATGVGIEGSRHGGTDEDSGHGGGGEHRDSEGHSPRRGHHDDGGSPGGGESGGDSSGHGGGQGPGRSGDGHSGRDDGNGSSKHGGDSAENHSSGSVSGSGSSGSGERGGSGKGTSGSSSGSGSAGDSGSSGSGSADDSGSSGSSGGPSSNGSSGGSSGSGETPTPTESGSEAVSEPPRDSGGDDGLEGQSNPQPEEDG